MAESAFHIRLTPYAAIFKQPLSKSLLDCVFSLTEETTYLIFLPKLHNLTLIMKEHQTKPNWRDMLKNNWPKFFKNVNVVKIKEKPENCSRCMILDWILGQKESIVIKKNYENN